MSQVSPQREKPGPEIRMFRWLDPVFRPLLIRLYRLRGGRLVGSMGVLHLTTVGRRSGQPRSVIVGYKLGGEDAIVVGSSVARPTLPAWLLNLRAHPEAEVRLGRERYQARAEFLEWCR